MISYDVQLLERAFKIFNSIYFNGELPTPILTIQTSPRCNGYISTTKIWKSSKDSYFEINISAENISRPIEQVYATLIHEMTHLYCMINNIKHVSNLGRYHSKVFKREAEARGLIIQYAKTIGWSVTSPSPELVQVIKDNGLYENIDHARITKDTEGTKIRKPSSTRTYACPNCSCSVRSTRDWFLICGTCMETMVKIK